MTKLWTASLLSAVVLVSSAGSANAQTSDSAVDEGTHTAGAIEAQLDGSPRKFDLVEAHTGQYDHWGSGWMAQANVLYAVLWGVEESDAETAREDDALIVRLSFWLKGDGPFEVEPLTSRCNPMENYVEWVEGGLGGQNILQGGGECGTVEVDAIRFDEKANEYVIEGRFTGTMDVDGVEVSGGSFQARLSEYGG